MQVQHLIQYVSVSSKLRHDPIADSRTSPCSFSWDLHPIFGDGSEFIVCCIDKDVLIKPSVGNDGLAMVLIRTKVSEYINSIVTHSFFNIF